MTTGAHRLGAVLLLAASCLALTGCTPTGTEPGSSGVGPTAVDPAPSAAASTPSAIGHATLSPEPDAAVDAAAAAVAAVAAYCRPQVSKGEWMVGLAPLLTDSAVIAYETVDPAVVPCSSVVGDSAVRDGDGAYVYRVDVPTDAGVYDTTVTRPSTDAPWRVERMAPPE